MTVSELIAILQQFDPSLRVLQDGYEDGLDDITPAHVHLELVRVNENPDDPGEIYGQHRAVNDADFFHGETFTNQQCVCITRNEVGDPTLVRDRWSLPE